VSEEDLGLSAKVLDQIEAGLASQPSAAGTGTILQAINMNGDDEKPAKKQKGPIIVFDGKKRHTSSDFTAEDLKQLKPKEDHDDMQIPMHLDTKGDSDSEEDVKVENLKVEGKAKQTCFGFFFPPFYYWFLTDVCRNYWPTTKAS